MGRSINSNSVRMADLDKIHSALQSDSHRLRRRDDGGVEVYKSGFMDKVKDFFGLGPSPAEKQQLAKEMLKAAVAGTTGDQAVADDVIADIVFDPVSTDRGGFLGSAVIDKAKQIH